MDKKYSKANIKLFVIVAYIGPFFLFGKLSEEKDNKLVKFHCTQGLTLFVFEIISHLIVFLISLLLSFSGALHEVVPMILLIGIWVITLIMVVMGIYSALRNKLTPLPFLGDVIEAINKNKEDGTDEEN